MSELNFVVVRPENNNYLRLSVFICGLFSWVRDAIYRTARQGNSEVASELTRLVSTKVRSPI
ncbi:MAG: hypothetical protein ACRC11_14565 [Xenococcaceae cyanobacterium]